MSRPRSTNGTKWTLPWALYWVHLFLLPSNGIGQTVTSIIRQFEIQDGLSHRMVSSIIEDQHGFIWLGSEKTLQRFDGNSFETWSAQKNHPGLRDIQTMGLDGDGWLWLWNNTDLKFFFFNTLTEEVKSEQERFGGGFPIHKNSEGVGWLDMRGNIPCDSKGRMLFPMNDPHRIVFYDSDHGFSQSELSREIPPRSFFVTADSHDDLWFVYPGETSILFRTNINGEIELRDTIPACNGITVMSQTDRQLTLLCSGATDKYFIEIDLEQGRAQAVPSGEETFRIHLDDFMLRLLPLEWEVSSEGEGHKVLLSLPLDKYNQSFHKSILTTYRDSKGRVWIGSEWGLTSWAVRMGNFDRYLWTRKGRELPFQNTVRGILVTEDMLYANLESVGLVAVPKDHPDEWELLDKDLKGVDTKNVFLSSRPLIRHHDGSLLMAQSEELIYIHPSTREKQVTPLNDNRFWHIWSLYEDEANRLWVGGAGVLGLLADGRPLQVSELWPDDKTWKVVYQIIPDGKGNLWLSTSNGLLLFDPASRKVKEVFGQERTGSHHLPSSVIHWHHIDSDSTHWLATDQGLVEWDPRTGQCNTYTTLDGLSSDVVYAIHEDSFGSLWLSSEYGIMRFIKESHEVRSYLENEGITQNEFNRISAFQASDGKIYFGGLNGVTALQPADFSREKDTHPVIQITGVELYEMDENKYTSYSGELRTTRQITLGPSVTYIRIQFAIPNPMDEKLLLYAWRFKENGESWAYQKTNFIQLATLPYGTHALQIMGKDYTGNWSEPLEIMIRVPRPFYLQTWFFILIALVIVAGTLLVFKRRTSILLRRQKQLEADIEAATAKILEDKQTIARQVTELQQLDKTKSRFFANVAHEFRTPLTLIYGPLSTVINSAEITPANLRLLTMARENTSSLVKMIGAIMDLTKLESGKMELQEESLHLQTWITQFAAGFESLMQQKGIDFQLTINGNPDFTWDVDREKLHTILKNLLANAVKFTPAGGQIQIIASGNVMEVLMVVRDTGRGIHPDDLPFIFERFFQSQQSGAPVEGGTGIGLALCREFARIMGGRLTVVSQLGEGSVFTLWLPYREATGKPRTTVVVDQPNAVHEELPEVPLPPSSATRHSLLVVEDNLSLQDYLRTILSPTYDLQVAGNGRQALELLRQRGPDHLPDLVISDVMMPEMDGYQLLESLKGSAQWGHLPVIMLTARAGLEDKLRALQIGVDDYLTKPFEEVELLTRVANLLRNAAGRKETPEPDQQQTDEVPLADREWLSKLEAYILQHIRESELSVTGLSKEFAMSESTFRRHVKRVTGLTPQDYLNEHKLNRARQLIESGSGMSILEVAEEVGFEDAKAFTRSFKNRFGKPPSQFKR